MTVILELLTALLEYLDLLDGFVQTEAVKASSLPQNSSIIPVENWVEQLSIELESGFSSIRFTTEKHLAGLVDSHILKNKVCIAHRKCATWHRLVCKWCHVAHFLRAIHTLFFKVQEMHISKSHNGIMHQSGMNWRDYEDKLFAFISQTIWLLSVFNLALILQTK